MTDMLLSAPASPGADSDAGALLPPEVLALIFAHADPATLLVSLRALSRTWRAHIDTILLPSLFAAGTWRVGLQVTRKPRFGRAWRGAIVGPPAAAVAASTAPAPMDAHEAAALAARLRSIPGVREDELPAFPGGPPPQPLTHVIPLAFTGIAPDGLSFATPKNTYHALFEPAHAPLGGEPDAARDEAAANAMRDARREARLDLDFAVVWRFPGDGGEGEWDTPDTEGGWISRFYCSHHDVSEPAPRAAEEPPLMQGLDPQVVAEEGVERAIAYSTPVARRTRAIRTDELGERLLNAERSGHALDWDDSGMEVSINAGEMRSAC
ncbi:hypothetical protein FA09DRAFT_26089 [Tilletiopsis washingtonensis]|uniref:F-box domain-containing protein n=1 Tax=Tilletiopsis washingtonensis TaxID=58919 RepID=A0A316ZBD0_9BASI|nr:hypothetical protein FA09DRAFT_26089 [Tilletiopsis washingtonensis]PWN98334.1 hypothetical protein FA09DRAFT_26089 [Tilletiopsis washingtonensis]